MATPRASSFFAERPSLLIPFFTLLFMSLTAGVRADERPAVVVAALGDSTTAGTPFFRSPLEQPPDGAGDPHGAYGYWMQKVHPDWRVANLGVAGQRSDQIAGRLDQALSLKPDYLVVLAGVNDVYQGLPASHVIKTLDGIYTAAHGTRVVACTVLPYNGMPSDQMKTLLEINTWIKTRATKRSLLFCDTFALVENPLVPGTLSGTSDGLHPDIAGYRAMGESLARVIDSDITNLKQKS